MASLASLGARRLVGARGRLDVLRGSGSWCGVQHPAIRQSTTGANGTGTMEAPNVRDAAADEPATAPAEAGTVRPRDELEVPSQSVATPANDSATADAPAKRYAPITRSNTFEYIH